MWNNWFKNINILEKNINLIDGKCKDVNKEIKRYQKRLDRAGAFDIQILGIGTDGHIGFNEPGTSIDSNCHMVYLDKIAASKILKNKDFTNYIVK